MDGVDHHMIGYLEANEEPTSFVAEAIERLEELRDHEVIPVVVGGSTSLTLPLLRDALNRGWRMAAITLLPHQSTYLSNIESRLDDMVEAGLLEELSGLKVLEDKHLNGKPDFHKGIWKAIGYQELYPYLAARKMDVHCDQLLKSGLASMKANTFQYGITQLEWIRQVLCPFLHAEKIANMSLAVVDKTSWILDVEKPAIRMASDFCHASTSISFHSINGYNPRVLCIFGGSSSGNDPAHIEAAKSLGRICHENNIKIVYGGGTTGVMGAIASTLVDLSGPDAVHGIIPEALFKYEAKESGRHPKDPAYARYGKQTVVKDMHTRKRLMIQEVITGGEGSGFVGLSGGYGTLEELFEVVTWHQLGIHDRGVCLLNTGGFFDGLVNWLGNVVQEGFIGLEDASILSIASTAEGVVRDKEEHAYRRKAWDMAFSSKALREYEARVAGYTTQLVEQIEASQGTPIDASSWFNFYSFDVMGDLAFGRSFDMLKNGTSHPFMELVHSNMLMAGSLTHLPWIFPLLKRIPVLNRKNLEFQGWLKQQVDWRQKNKLDLPDVFSWILSDYDALNKPTAQDTINLRGDAQLIAVAGSDTTAASLACLFFELAANPEACLHLQRELDQYYADHDKPDHSSLSKLRYLSASLYQRIYAPLPGYPVRLAANDSA
ncbi:hypothetical protein FVER53590_05671 [Fusarium verticillioides]|nr:hypothetical protein FVER53590_05671 [Fusarium verticillioides]